MAVSAAAILASAASVLAAPSQVHSLDQQANDICPQLLFNSPSCCKKAVLGLVGIGCSDMPGVANSTAFKDACKSKDELALCCTVKVGGLADVLCVPVQ
ncbi:hypothetical protein O9K51_05847 [Purpureocillium lavendulum]|uniref:Hydrophobin n=1 Tax=Purpureocillium lavendulum TaxID=1247861 RepID=A0AB34FTZ8_9HYPO|nr:hypothetical protein O9K51_05847 [Purpureocillium lavendulum]